MEDTTKRDNSGPAFPEPFLYDPDRGVAGEHISGSDAGAEPGMTLREYYAGEAIGAAARSWSEANESQRKAISGCVDTGIILARDYPQYIENMSRMIADAMVAAR